MLRRSVDERPSVMHEEVVDRLATAQSLFVLTGSGISVESGLPTFRGVGGLWRTRRVEELASPEGFSRDPRLVWTWYNERKAAHARVKPNAGHTALARLERLIPKFTLATQNVDSLHLLAGSQNVLELHGNLRDARCDRCGARRAIDERGLPLDEIDHSCGGRMRPDIVWFGEPLPEEGWRRAREAASEADVILVIGTSAVVYPAALLATSYNTRACVVEVNPEATEITSRVGYAVRGAAAVELPRIVDAVQARMLEQAHHLAR